MNFSDPLFLVFLLISFIAAKNVYKLGVNTNYILVFFSLIFYVSGGFIYVFVILSTSIIDFNLIKIIRKESTKYIFKKLCVLFSVMYNLGILFFFKYLIFAFTFISEITNVNFILPDFYDNIIIPLGISFFTFQSLSAVLDTFKKTYNAESLQYFDYLNYLVFFPQLIAGPISRASDLLLKLKKPKILTKEKFIFSIYYILTGLVLKSVVADSLSVYVDATHRDVSIATSPQLLLSAIFFSFQIYADFLGYCLIGLGSALLFGVKLPINFRYPYFSNSISEFWRRWHITLGRWFKDYVYVPLIQLHDPQISIISRTVIPLFVVFILSGLWHGADYTFLLWGALHGTFVMFERLVRSKYKLRLLFLGKLYVFVVVTILWIPFRTESLDDLNFYIINFFGNFSTRNFTHDMGVANILYLLTLISLLLLFELIFSKKQFFILKILLKRPVFIQSFMILVIILFRNHDTSPFVYFRF